VPEATGPLLRHLHPLSLLLFFFFSKAELKNDKNLTGAQLFPENLQKELCPRAEVRAEGMSTTSRLCISFARPG
jgi:hypothetical protein